MIARNNIIPALVLLIMSATTLLAGAYLSYFHVRSENENIVLTWQTTQEINVKHFVVERRSSNGPFNEIDIIQARGNNTSYSYTDESAYKTNDAIYAYRLKIVDNNGNVSYSIEVSVSHNPSPVKRTWGSIKALFR